MSGDEEKSSNGKESFLRKSIDAYAKKNQRWAEFQSFRDKHIETLLEYTFGLVDPPLIRRLYPMVPDEAATAQRLKGRFPWLVLLDYVLDCDGKSASEVEKYMTEFAMLLEMTSLEDQNMEELSSYVLCEFKLQTCLAYVRETGPKRLSNDAIKKKIKSIYGDLDVTAEDLLSSQNRAHIVTTSLLVKDKEELEALFDITKKGKSIIDEEATELLATEHPWKEFADCMKHYIQQLQLSAFGFPRLMSLLDEKRGERSAENAAAGSTPAELKPEQSGRLKQLKKTFFSLGGSQDDWDAAAKKADKNFEAFEEKIKKFNRRLGRKLQKKKALPHIRISALEQFDDEVIDDSEIIGRNIFAEIAASNYRSPSKERRSKSSSRASKRPRITEQRDAQSEEETNTEVEFVDTANHVDDDGSDTDGRQGEGAENKGPSSQNKSSSAGSSAGKGESSKQSSTKAQEGTTEDKSGRSAANALRLNENVDVANFMSMTKRPFAKDSGKKVPKKRVRWSAEELSALKYGVEEFGEGNWSKILKMSEQFHTCRDAVSLKDKWRNLKLKEARLQD